MFRRLIANLPYNPSLIEEVSFYAGRLRRETAIRRIGFLFMTLTMLVQVYAVMAPPEPSLALSNNDIIPGGIRSVSEAHRHCLENNYQFADIIRSYGIICDNLTKATQVQIRSSDHGGKLYSMGRLPYGKPGEVAFPVEHVGTLYMRPLTSWDNGWPSSYTALAGRNIFGVEFIILFNCGNLVIIGEPTPPPPPPQPVAPPQPTIIYDPPPQDACPAIAGIQSSPADCKPCPSAASSTDGSACIVLSKTAQNLSKNAQDAHNTTASGGDKILYTLKATNTGKIDITNFIFEENISDVLDYADLTDSHGGSLQSNKMLKWPPLTLRAGQSQQKTITVTIKNPIPATPASVSDPGHYDLLMTNVYGNTVNIKLPPPVIKTAEVVTQTLPKTGPGSSLLIGFMATSLVGYLFARSRTMAEELAIIRTDYVSGGSF